MRRSGVGRSAASRMVASAFPALGGIVLFVAALAKRGVKRDAAKAGSGSIPAGATTRILARSSRVTVVAGSSLGATMTVALLGRGGGTLEAKLEEAVGLALRARLRWRISC